MGALHAGHLSLVERCKSECDITIASIFVNPTQFSPTEDLDKYPRDLKNDKKLLIEVDVDYVFIPKEEQIYPYNFQTYVSVEEMARILEGEFRPSHFKGVTTIVNILFNCVNPDFAYFGQKDAQQVAVIQQMVSDLKMGIDIVVCPIVRESDGLAMSSRNVYLSSKEREKASTLHKVLLYGRKLVEEGREMNPRKVLDNMEMVISEEKLIKLDYVAIVNAYGFREVDRIEGGNEYYILVAAKVGGTRLIDNELVRLS